MNSFTFIIWIHHITLFCLLFNLLNLVQAKKYSLTISVISFSHLFHSLHEIHDEDLTLSFLKFKFVLRIIFTRCYSIIISFYFKIIIYFAEVNDTNTFPIFLPACCHNLMASFIKRSLGAILSAGYLYYTSLPRK